MKFWFIESIYLFLAACYETWSDQWPEDITVFVSLSKYNDLYESFQNKHHIMLLPERKWWILLLKKEPKNTENSLQGNRSKSKNCQETYYTSHEVNDKYHNHKQTKNRTSYWQNMLIRWTGGFSIKEQLLLCTC